MSSKKSGRAETVRLVQLSKSKIPWDNHLQPHFPGLKQRANEPRRRHHCSIGESRGRSFFFLSIFYSFLGLIFHLFQKPTKSRKRNEIRNNRNSSNKTALSLFLKRALERASCFVGNIAHSAVTMYGRRRQKKHGKRVDRNFFFFGSLFFLKELSLFSRKSPLKSSLVDFFQEAIERVLEGALPKRI